MVQLRFVNGAAALERIVKLPPQHEPLHKFIEQLITQGFTQAQIAGAAGLTRQYLNDLLCCRRPLTELVARRIGEKFSVDYRALLGHESRGSQPGLASGPSSTAGEWLPVFPYPIEGDPICHPRWAGTYVPVPAMAAPKLISAVHPYVLRFGNIDVEGRLHKNDLVLISQSPKESAQIVVIRAQNKCLLCRRKGRSWVRVANGKVLTGACEVVGHCVGVLWSALD
jgi:transcriptional regulator with XRE-family HTH domain